MRAVTVFVLAVVVVVCLMTAHASAADSFSDDFADAPSATDWINAADTTDPSGRIYYDDTEENILFDQADGRDYLRTLDVDYADADFTATIKLTLGRTGPWGSAFFGLGTGTSSDGSPYWGEPKIGDFVYMRLNGDGFNDNLFNVRAGESGVTSLDAPVGDGTKLAIGETVGVQFVWHRSAAMATFTVDLDNNGTYGDGTDVAYTTPALDYMVNSTENTRLFLGGANGVRGDDFSVTATAPTLMPGDANLNGTVDENDAATLAANWLTMSGANWSMGDFNGDHMVNDIDAAMMAANWGWTDAAAVPEPSAFVLLGAGLLALLVAVRRKKE